VERGTEAPPHVGRYLWPPYYSSSLRIRSRCAMCLRQRGVMLAVMDGRIRACTHLDVTAPMIEDTVGLVREIVRRA
jgi:hypothetical protein